MIARALIGRAVLDAGRLVQAGSPDELLKDKDGEFYRLVQRQMS